MRANVLHMGWLLGFVLCVASQSTAQERATKANWALAEKYSREFLDSFTYSTSLRPTWIGESNVFWYRFQTSTGTRYWRVDAAKGVKEPLFDHVLLAALVSETTRRPVEHLQLDLRDLSVADDGLTMTFVSGEHKLEWTFATQALKDLGKPEQPAPNPNNGFANFRNGGRRPGQPERENTTFGHRNFSPDFTAYVFTKDDDLYYVEASDEVKAEVAAIRERLEKEKAAKEAGGGDAAEKKDGEKKDEQKQDVEKKDDQKKEDVQEDGDVEKKEDVEKKDGKEEEGEKKDEDGKQEGEQGEQQEKKDTEQKDGEKTDTEKQDTEKKDTEEKDGEQVQKDGEKKDGEQQVEQNQRRGDRRGRGQRGTGREGETQTEGQEPATPPEPEIDERGRWALKIDETQALRLSEGGEEKYSFARRGGRGAGNRRQQEGEDTTTTQEKTDDKDKGKEPANVTWAEDSSSFYAQRNDSRGVEELYLVNSLSLPRPTLEKYEYPMPGEENVQKTELHVFDRASKSLRRAGPKWKDETFQDMHWGADGSELRFLRRDRPMRNQQFVSVDTRSGEVRVLIEDGFEATNVDAQSVREMKDRKQMIWWSERSGWGHYYLYDQNGKLLNAITRGAWRADRIVDVDEAKGILWFTGNGREAGENIYHQHLYRVYLDGTGLTLLDPGNAHHESSLSKDHQFVVDSYAAIDLAPKALLRDSNGAQIMDLEAADLSQLEKMGWKLPETFVVKAADGVTDLFGNLWKPFDFDPRKKYPVIANVYPGPQTEGVSNRFSVYSSTMQLAQLGFIVIQVGHRGGTPERSKFYHGFGYGNLRDYALADKKSAIQQLAAQNSWIDVDRVGIYGHSGGGFFTAAALLQKPYNEFFKVGVSSAGNHDNNVYHFTWSERYHGMQEVEVKTEENADSSRGRSGRNGQGGQGGQGGQFGQRGGPEEAEAADADDWRAYQAFLAEVELAQEQEKQEQEKKEQEKQQKEEEQEQKKEEQEQQKQEQQQDVQQEKKEDGEKQEEQKQDEQKQDGEKKDEQKQDEKKEEAEKKMRWEIKIPTNAELAPNLLHHLMLVHGDMDNNVHPAGTIRLVDALIKANKRFDLLFLPGQRHGFGSANDYFTQAMYEYFAEHLLGDHLTGPDLLDKSH